MIVSWMMAYADKGDEVYFDDMCFHDLQWICIFSYFFYIPFFHVIILTSQSSLSPILPTFLTLIFP